MLFTQTLKNSYQKLVSYGQTLRLFLRNKTSRSATTVSAQEKMAKVVNASGKPYFIAAKSWADDLYTQTVISRNRYKLAFFIAMGLAILLTIAIDGLIPLQHITPLLVNHYQDGRLFVQPMSHAVAPHNSAEIQSELVRYVINRESYDPTSYDEQYSLVTLLSSRAVAKAYSHLQSTSNPSAPINVLGNHGFRTVHVDSVIFLTTAKQTKHPLAQVDFTITDHQQHSAVKKTIPLTALIAWTYRKLSHDPSDRWRDWNGFTVTRYTVEQQNVSEKK